MADDQRRVYLNDSKSRIRETLNLQSKEKDEDFHTFEVGLLLISTVSKVQLREQIENL